jgi:hypothetical protein
MGAQTVSSVRIRQRLLQLDAVLSLDLGDVQGVLQGTFYGRASARTVVPQAFRLIKIAAGSLRNFCMLAGHT